MAPITKRIAVIGGGFSGVSSISMVKDEGMEPVCFEKLDALGGTWYYREESEVGVASIMPTTVINHSKEMGAFSNFPPRKEFNNYMKHTEIYEYLKEYVKCKDLERYIRYNMEVVKVRKSEDYKTTGRWSVTARNRLTGEEETDIFDGVMVCIGHINNPYIPVFPGQSDFKGEILHTHSLKGVERYKDKRVVVVGIGCSALDAAVEISRVAKQVYLSSRSGAFVINRVGPSGYPIDYIMFRRYLTTFLDILPTNLCSWYVETFYLDRHFDHRLYAIKPKYHLLSKDPMVNDHIAAKLLSGAVKQTGDIGCFTENGVIFRDESTETKADVIVMATGYTYDFPFLENGTVVNENGIINLYKCMYPPQLPHPTLSIIGFFLPYGPSWPIIELQSRLAASILAGKNKLPSENEMIKEIKRRHCENEKRYTPSEKMTLRVDFSQFMDELANELGVKPNFWRLLFTDPKLFLRLVFGPCLSYQYRLEGPHKWEGAREAIMTSDERIHWPLQKRKITKKGIFDYIIEYIVNLIPTNIYL
ncbi:flavin-containing monooxygenase 5-like [Uloborus diversus]|uniref:flavin-containing monooxygenase 5-like n=1 Tax=Uloborus diversus TaxID=327109 RepID=UPI00240A8950|nr:flavin-containing monooxygenase 5-like [Uloborus diversus]